MRASCIHQDNLFVCTIQGLFAMPVKSRILDPLPLKPEITHLKASFRGGVWSDTLPGFSSQWYLTDRTGFNIQGQPTAISISFRAINPVYPQKLKYSFRKDSEDSPWSPFSPEMETIWFDPGPGQHVFWVRTSYDGITCSTPSRLTFSIEAPWYQRTWVLVLGLLLVFVVGGISARTLIKSLSDQQHFHEGVSLPEKTSQVILLIFAIFYPVTQLVSARFEQHVVLNPVLLFLTCLATIGFFGISLFSPSSKKHIRLFLSVSFLLFLFDTGTSVIQSNMAPYHVVALLYISSISFLVFDRYWQILGFGVALNVFAFWCGQNISQPLYSPVPFQMGATGLSVVLFIIHLSKKSVEDKLSFSNKVVNSGPVLILGFRFDGSLVFASENISEILGYSSQEVGGKMWWSDVVSREEDVVTLLHRIQDQKESEVKAYLRNKKGEFRKFQFSGRALSQDMMVLLGQDITDRESLEIRFEHLIENAPDAIYQTDIHGTMIYANPQTSFILGIPNTLLIGRKYTEFIRPEEKESVVEFYRNQTRNRIPSTYHEFPVVTKNGQVRWLGFQVSLLLSEGGRKIDGYLSIGRDITERLEAEQLIQHQHKNITDSLTYASRIKSAILPGETALKSLFTHAAVYNKPKDIIGGDFFWLAHEGKKHYFAVGDCTGHGVPGAFMTTIAVGLLREIVKDESLKNVEEILGFFNRSLVRLLGANSEIQSPDFVELALLSIDFEDNSIQFISSGIELHMVRKGEIYSYKEGSRGQNYRYDYRGLSQTISIQPGDVFYLFTDGMFDQLGGPGQKRLTRKRLLKIIRDSNHSSLLQGLEEIKSGVEEWQGSFPQIDDRLLISFRL
jgi:PAS domain S-box-containing protein